MVEAVRQVGAGRGQQWWGKDNASLGSQPRKSCQPEEEVRSPSEGLGSVHHVLQPLQEVEFGLPSSLQPPELILVLLEPLRNMEASAPQHH